MRIFHLAILTVTLLTVFAPGAVADSVLVRSGSPSFGYGTSGSTTLTGLLDTATGHQVTVTGSFANNAQVQGFDALWVNTDETFQSLSATEIANIQQFAGSGRRVVLMGEHLAWTTWDDSLLAVVGGTLAGSVSGPLTTLHAHALTAGVATVDVPLGAVASLGGTSLFSRGVATLWGPHQNVLTYLDGNLPQDFFIGDADNLRFTQNLAAWIASAPPHQVPEPASLALVGLGLLGASAVRRKRGARVRVRAGSR